MYNVSSSLLSDSSTYIQKASSSYNIIHARQLRINDTQKRKKGETTEYNEVNIKRGFTRGMTLQA
jgi:hypothetical protein